MTKQEQLAFIQRQWSTCQACPLSQTRHNVVVGYGSPDARLMVIGEAPGEEEDLTGHPFVGQAGQLLDQYLASVSVHPVCKRMRERGEIDFQQFRQALLEEVFYTNIIACRPPENRNPQTKEIAACKPRLHSLIYIVDPWVILAIGKVALEALTGQTKSILTVRGEVFDIEVQGYVTKIRYPALAVIHPSYLLRNQDLSQPGGLMELTFNDVLKGYRLVDQEFWHHFSLPRPSDRPEPSGKGT